MKQFWSPVVDSWVLLSLNNKLSLPKKSIFGGPQPIVMLCPKPLLMNGSMYYGHYFIHATWCIELHQRHEELFLSWLWMVCHSCAWALAAIVRLLWSQNQMALSAFKSPSRQHSCLSHRLNHMLLKECIPML